MPLCQDFEEMDALAGAEVTATEYDKVKSTLRQFVRDWTAEVLDLSYSVAARSTPYLIVSRNDRAGSQGARGLLRTAARRAATSVSAAAVRRVPTLGAAHSVVVDWSMDG